MKKLANFVKKVNNKLDSNNCLKCGALTLLSVFGIYCRYANPVNASTLGPTFNYATTIMSYIFFGTGAVYGAIGSVYYGIKEYKERKCLS